MVKNTECLNTTDCCVMFQRCSKGMFKIIQFPKITEEKKLFREYFE